VEVDQNSMSSLPAGVHEQERVLLDINRGGRRTHKQWHLYFHICIKVQPGQDNVIRVVSLLTGQGTLVRPVVKLVRLHTE